MLSAFLESGNPSARGTPYQLVALALQLTVAVVVGGLKRPGQASVDTARLQVILIAFIQLVNEMWALCGDPADKLLGASSLVCGLFECAASLLILCAAIAIV